jgi:RNA polymerase sigma-B factor
VSDGHTHGDRGARSLRRVGHVPARPSGARRARRWLDGVVPSTSSCGAEAALLLSEVVNDVVLYGDLDGLIHVETRPVPGHLRVEVVPAVPRGTHPGERIGLRVLDALARRWGEEWRGKAVSAWFEVRLPGAGAGLASAPDEALFERAGDDPEARDQLFARYGALASSLSRRFRRSGVDPEDLEQVAAMALIKAIGRYAPEAGAFAPFATATVSGELKRYLRDRAWSVRVPRSLQEAALGVSSAGDSLAQRLGGPPSVAELAAETGLPEDVVADARVAWDAFRSTSLDAPVGDQTGPTLLETIGGDDPAIGLTERWLEVESALSTIPERSRRILYLRFYGDMTQSEIASVVGISQMHVSRLLADAVQRLRDILRPSPT